ncbi:glycosyltransferase [Baaleninema sp.]|uniref:glycosyltransferase n=1 Tax=Baaleninema sp. TaxID=3101197 RepID=UPI003CFE33FD
MNQTLIVTGMHRSGTSLMASLIQKVGVHIGDELLEADDRNRHGYFEDREFLEFQRSILQACCVEGEEGWPDWGWTVSERLDRSRFEDYKEIARRLIQSRQESEKIWGWKDPRTALLLEFWHELIPDAKYLFVYRYPWDVADSIARLNAPIFADKPDWALRIWSYYNRHILDFYKRHFQQCLLVHTNTALNHPEHLSKLLKTKLNLELDRPLTTENVAEIYDPNLLQTLDWNHPFAESIRTRASRHWMWLMELDRAAEIPSEGEKERKGEAGREALSSPSFQPPLPLAVAAKLPEVKAVSEPRNDGDIAVSVVIPCYNQGEYLLEAIASVQSCQAAVYEILIINDASTDSRTLKVLDYLKQRGFRVIDHPENRGLAEARNTGFRLARGRYVLPLDADNKIKPNYITQAIDLFDRDPRLGVVYGDCEYIGDKIGVWEIPEFDINRLAVGNYIDACAVVRKTLWEDCGGYDPDIPEKLGYEDWDLWLSAAERGWKFHHVSEVLFQYRFRRDSMVSRCNIPDNRQRLMHYLCAKHLSLYVTNFPSIFAKKDSELLAERLRVEELKTEIENLKAEVTTQQTDSLHFQSELHQSNLEIQQLQAQLFPTEAELKRTHAEADDLRHENRQLHQKLFEALQQLEATTTELNAVKENSTIANEQLQKELIAAQQQIQALQAEYQAMQAHLQGELMRVQQAETAAQETIAAMEDTKFWKLREQWFKVKTPVMRKLGLLKEDPPAAVPIPTSPTPPVPEENPYQWWLSQHYPRPSDLERMAEDLETLEFQPTISIVMPVYNTPADYLEQAIDSVLDQVYPHWELCIADDASSAPQVRQTLDKYTTLDARIQVAYRTENGHISRASNTALELACGEFVALMDHDDLMTPDALFEVVRLLNRHREADMVYSDEDKVDERNQLRDPFFKPDWCPDSFLSRMYTCHLGVYRRSILEEIGGFRVGFEGAQDYDLVLRFTEKSDRIFHIPKILYHWRSHPESTASRLASKSYAAEAAAKAITESLQRRGEPGIVKPTDSGHWIVRYNIQKPGKVSVIIPTKDLASVLDTCLTSIFEKTTYAEYEVMVVDNGSVEAQTHQLFEKWRQRQPHRFRVELLDIPFNYSQLNNFAASKAEGDYLLFLNNDTEVVTEDWMEAMVEQAQRPSIGAVGATLLYPDNTIQHAGVVLGIGGVAGHSHKTYPKDAIGYFAQLQTTNNYSAVTAACLMCRREVFEEVGGFEERLAIAFNDVDFCLRLVDRGYRNVCLSHVVLYHYESKSRGHEDTREKQIRFKQEIDYMKHQWAKYIENDPCYSPHLSREHEDYSLAVTNPLMKSNKLLV